MTARMAAAGLVGALALAVVITALPSQSTDTRRRRS